MEDEKFTLPFEHTFTNATLLFYLFLNLSLFLSSRVIGITVIEHIVLKIAENSFILRGEIDLIGFDIRCQPEHISFCLFSHF